MSNLILVDVDDTINDMTGDMCKAFNPEMERVTLDKILQDEVPEGFQAHRLEFLSNIENWSCGPAGVGAKLIPMINNVNRFKAVICTKTPTKVGTYDVATEKVKFQQKHYPGTDSLIVIGDKTIVDARGIIDDMVGNCLHHNKKHDSAYLVFEHGRTTENHVKMFLDMCKYEHIEGKHAALVVAKYHNMIIKFERSNGEVALPCGKVDEGESYEAAARREFWEETGIDIADETMVDYGTMLTKTGWKVGVFFVDLSHRNFEGVELNQPEEFKCEGRPIFCLNTEVGKPGDENYEFNNVLMHNLKLTPKYI